MEHIREQFNGLFKKEIAKITYFCNSLKQYLQQNQFLRNYFLELKYFPLGFIR